MIKKVQLNELKDPIQSFLAQVGAGDAVLVADSTGRIQYSVVRYTERPTAERETAWRDIQQIQTEVGEMMERTGKTEGQFDRLLQEIT